MQQGHQEGIEQESVRIPNSILIPEVVRCLHANKTVTLPLHGFSMRPFLEDGRDKALLSLPHDIRKGDAVLAEIAPGKYVLHRIIDISSDNITLLGDGNLTPEHCKTADVRAKAIGFFRKGHSAADMTDGRKWRLYSALWMALRPLRRWLLAFYRRIWIRL